VNCTAVVATATKATAASGTTTTSWAIIMAQNKATTRTIGETTAGSNISTSFCCGFLLALAGSLYPAFSGNVHKTFRATTIFNALSDIVRGETGAARTKDEQGVVVVNGGHSGEQANETQVHVALAGPSGAIKKKTNTFDC